MNARLVGAGRVLLAALPLLALPVGGPSVSAQAPPSPMLTAAQVGPGYQAATLATPLVNCALLARRAPGATCTEDLWHMRPSVASSLSSTSALDFYQLVVQTGSPQAAESLGQSLQRPWAQPAFHAVYAAVWRASFAVSPGAAKSHYADWWWFVRGSELGLMAFVVRPNTVTFAYDQAMRDVALADLDVAAFSQDVSGVTVGVPMGTPLLTGRNLGSAYARVTEPSPLASCAAVTGAATGYTCAQGVWKLSPRVLSSHAADQAVAIYEMVVQTPSDADAQALNRADTKPWTTPGLRPADRAMWALANKVDPGLSSLQTATGDWWTAVRGKDFLVLDFMVVGEGTAVGDFEQTVNDVAVRSMSAQAFVAAAMAAAGA